MGVRLISDIPTLVPESSAAILLVLVVPSGYVWDNISGNRVDYNTMNSTRLQTGETPMRVPDSLGGSGIHSAARLAAA